MMDRLGDNTDCKRLPECGRERKGEGEGIYLPRVFFRLNTFCSFYVAPFSQTQCVHYLCVCVHRRGFVFVHMFSSSDALHIFFFPFLFVFGVCLNSKKI